MNPISEAEGEAGTRATSFDVAIANNKQLEAPLSSNGREEKAQLWMWLSFPICASLVLLAVPSSSFPLYKKSIQEVLDLKSEEIQDIVSFALIGGYALCFIPGLLYDACGYTVTVISGGVMASLGSFLWYWLLKDGGEPGSPTWYGLALALMLMCHGCRHQYVAGMCGILSIFPQSLISSVSAAMAVSAALGHVVLPLIWSWFFLPQEATTPEGVSPVSGTLADLKPVAGLYLLLAVIYASITITGLTIARWLKPQQTASAGSSFGQKLRRLRDPVPMAQVVLVVFTMSFVEAFMKSGVADAAHHAGASTAEVGAILGWMGTWGLVAGFSSGLSTDLLRAYTPVGQAAQEFMFVVAISCVLLGYCLVIGGNVSWSIAACIVSFGRGGLFALYPAAVRTAFPKDEVGFWLGGLTSLMGALSWVYGRLGVVLEWNATMYVFGSVAALMTILMFCVVACIRKRQLEPAMARQLSDVSSLLVSVSGIWPSSRQVTMASSRQVTAAHERQVSGQEQVL